MLTDYRLRIFSLGEFHTACDAIINEINKPIKSEKFDDAGWTICWECEELSIEDLNHIVDKCYDHLHGFHRIAIQRRPRIPSELLSYNSKYFKGETDMPEIR